jgi:uncharacterized membrane protein YozB (DUF420 family)
MHKARMVTAFLLRMMLLRTYLKNFPIQNNDNDYGK